MTGGEELPGPDMENESVLHLVTVVAGKELATTPLGVGVPAPFKSKATLKVIVEGPVMTKLVKSNLNWHIFSLAGHILNLQDPISFPCDTK